MPEYTNVEHQDQLWKEGMYDYTEGVVSVKFDMCKFFIEREVKKPYRILDVGAGMSRIFPLLHNNIELYYYNDISQYVMYRFKDKNKELLCEFSKSKSLIFNAKRIENIIPELCKCNFNVILVLGAMPETHSKELVDKLLKIINNGILILDHNEMYDKYYDLGNKSQVKYQVSDWVWDPPAYSRIMQVMKNGT